MSHEHCREGWIFNDTRNAYSKGRWQIIKIDGAWEVFENGFRIQTTKVVQPGALMGYCDFADGYCDFADGLERAGQRREDEGGFLGYVNKPDGKVRPSLVDAGFIMAMAEVLEAGLKGARKREDWQRIPRPQALEECRDALLRHAFGQGPEDERQHLAAVACNAMILWWHLGQDDA